MIKFTKTTFVHSSLSLIILLISFGCTLNQNNQPVVVNQPALPSATSPPTTESAVTPAPSPTSSPTPSATASPTITPSSTPTITPTPSPTPSPTVNPFLAYTIEGLRERTYPGGEVSIRAVLTRTTTFTRYYIAYPSDDLTITGIMQMPPGAGPFPVVILNHGYISPANYWSGADTWRAAEYLNSRGYLTISPDFRGWGGSDQGENFFRTGLVIDILNLISSLPSVPQADPQRVGMWGHSMGAGATTKAITIDPRIQVAVLYGPVSASDQANIQRWGGGGGAIQDAVLASAYFQTTRNLDFLKLTSPQDYFHLVSAPVQIHIGEADAVTPPRWAETIRDGLETANKEVAYFTYPGQGHAFSGDSWDLFMERVADFFDGGL